MKIQNSKNSKQNDKDYSAVCHQQGRMITDFDLNEQALISRDRLNQALHDVIGNGTPRHHALLQIDSGNIPSLHWGKIYIDGIPAEARSIQAEANNPFNYNAQLYYPNPPKLPQIPYKLYADVWDRAVIWLEDEKLRDPGLYGADTTTRTQTMVQIKWCDQDIDPMCFASIGTARVHLTLRSRTINADPCDPCIEELELKDPVGNYLFRVEVHDVRYDDKGKPEMVVIKWSSENGAEAYRATDTPPDFANNQYVYEYFDDVSEKQLGRHPAHDNSEPVIDGHRIAIEQALLDAPPKDNVRRWNGWCKIIKTNSGWEVTNGFEGSFDLASGINSGPGKVTNNVDTINIELDVITMKIDLADHALLAGDYWNAAVRETVHQQNNILLKDSNSDDGALPEGEHHHYMTLVNVDENDNMSLPADSDCDKYKACQQPQFPSLTDLRADDICYDNSDCDLIDTKTVQGALDQLCKKNDLPWHNKHLHGWGIVCGLALSCDKDNPSSINLSSGYALDCEGRDLILDDSITIDVMQGIKTLQIANKKLDENQGICLYLDRKENNQLDIKYELYQEQQTSLFDKLQDSLLFDFYNDCVVELFDVFKAEPTNIPAKEQCLISDCGRQHIPMQKRKTQALSNIAFHKTADQSNAVLNVSACEHFLLKDLYDNLQKTLRSRTFCGQINSNQFPEYPFEKSCQASWFTPNQLDHIRVHPNGKLLYGWNRVSHKVYVFERSSLGCSGELQGIISLPGVNQINITDLVIDSKNNIFISTILREKSSFILTANLNQAKTKDCNINFRWKTTLFSKAKIVSLALSPWAKTSTLFAVALSKGIFLLNTKALLNREDNTTNEIKWAFPASGHMAFDFKSDRVFATAFHTKESISPPKVDIPTRPPRTDAPFKPPLIDFTAPFFKEQRFPRFSTLDLVSSALFNQLNGNTFSSKNSSENGYYNSMVYFDGKNSQSKRITTTLLHVNKSIIEGNDGFVVASSTNLSPFPLPDLELDLDLPINFDPPIGIIDPRPQPFPGTLPDTGPITNPGLFKDTTTATLQTQKLASRQKVVKTKTKDKDKLANPKKVKITNNRNYVLFVVANQGSDKLLYRFEANDIQAQNDGIIHWQGSSYHSFAENDQIALKYIRSKSLDGIVASRYNQNDIQYIPGDKSKFKGELIKSIAVQAGPVDLIKHDASERLFILNRLGQSVTVFDYDLKTHQKQQEKLKKYRDETLRTFNQLLSGVLQYLKDCFCHKLLVDCPEECENGDKVYLGCISIKDEQVHNICNFTKRKYVKTLPTLSYWLSVVPLGPVVNWVIEQLCCQIIPQNNNNLFSLNNSQLNLGRAVLNIDQSDLLKQLVVDGQDLFKKSLASLVGRGQKEKPNLQQLEFAEYTYRPGVFTQAKKPVSDRLFDQIAVLEQSAVLGQKHVFDLKAQINQLDPSNGLGQTEFVAIKDKIKRLELQNTNNDKQFEIFNKDKTNTKKTIEDLSQQLATFDSNKAVSDKQIENILKQQNLFSQLQKTDNKQFSKINNNAANTDTTIKALTQKLTNLNQDKIGSDALIKKLENQQKTFIQTQAEDKKLIRKITANNTSSQKVVKNLIERINVLNRNEARTDSVITNFQKQLKSFDDFRADILENRPVVGLGGINPKNQALLQAANISTVQQLAKTPVAELQKLGITKRTADKINKAANASLKPKN